MFDDTGKDPRREDVLPTSGYCIGPSRCEEPRTGNFNSL